MRNKPIISIVMPVYNCEKRVGIAIDSIISQTFIDWELIIVDDGSKDQSGYICDNYSRNDSRIIVKHLEKNSGVSFARNYGIKFAAGKYLEFIDSDDYLSNNALEVSLHAMDRYDLLFFSLELVIAKLKCSIEPEHTIYISSFNELKKEYVRLDSKDLFNSPCNKIYNLDIIRKNGIYFNENMSLGEDLIFNLNYVKYCESIIVISDVLYHCVDENMNSLSRKKREDYLEIQKFLKEKVDECFECDKEIYSYTSMKFVKEVMKFIKRELRDKNHGFQEKKKNIKYWMDDLVFCKSVKSLDFNKINFNDLKINYIDRLALRFHTIDLWIFVYIIRNAFRR